VSPPRRRDRTRAIAEEAGADVRDESDLPPGQGVVLARANAMWRALSVIESDVVVFLDAASEGFGPHFACAAGGPLRMRRYRHRYVNAPLAF